MSERGESAQVVRFGVFEVDLRTGELRRQGLRIKLQEKPFQLLAVLVERAGSVVSREELQRRLWPEDTFADFDNGLNTAISKLREALGDSAGQPRFLETVPRRGYSREVVFACRLEMDYCLARVPTPIRPAEQSSVRRRPR